jgi:hypothetical protein
VDEDRVISMFNMELLLLDEPRTITAHYYYFYDLQIYIVFPHEITVHYGYESYAIAVPHLHS